MMSSARNTHSGYFLNKRRPEYEFTFTGITAQFSEHLLHVVSGPVPRCSSRSVRWLSRYGFFMQTGFGFRLNCQCESSLGLNEYANVCAHAVQGVPRVQAQDSQGLTEEKNMGEEKKKRKKNQRNVKQNF